MRTKTWVKITLAISIGLMILALTQEAYCTAEDCMGSINVFIFGIFGIFIGGDETLSWFANPLLVLSWIFINNRKITLLLSLLSTLLALSFLMFDEVVINEAGHSKAITMYALGYWLWVGSHVVMLLGNVLILSNERSILKTETEK